MRSFRHHNQYYLTNTQRSGSPSSSRTSTSSAPAKPRKCFPKTCPIAPLSGSMVPTSPSSSASSSPSPRTSTSSPKAPMAILITRTLSPVRAYLVFSYPSVPLNSNIRSHELTHLNPATRLLGHPSLPHHDLRLQADHALQSRQTPRSGSLDGQGLLRPRRGVLEGEAEGEEERRRVCV